MPYNSEISIRVVVNGTDHSFQREFGCSCGRCKLPFFRANTSVSVIAVDTTNTLVWHCLIDVGAGVVNNLVDNLACFGGEPRVDQLLLTHWHPDHTIAGNRAGNRAWHEEKTENKRFRFDLGGVLLLIYRKYRRY